MLGPFLHGQFLCEIGHENIIRQRPCQTLRKIPPSVALTGNDMAHHSNSPPPRPSWGRRVPGAACSLLIASLFIVLSIWLAWRYPLTTLTCTPRSMPPSLDDPRRHVIVDGTMARSLWGLFTVGHADLLHITAFTAHTEGVSNGASASALRATTHEGPYEILVASPVDVIRWMRQLNAQLDAPEPKVFRLRHADWVGFSFSWTLLFLGSLVLIRNSLIAPWKRRYRARRLD